MARRIVLVAGKDLFAISGGHSTYVRVHARAAIRAGFEPHLFCVGPTTAIRDTDLGVLHRIASPFRPFRQTMVPLHGPRLARAVVEFAIRAREPQLLHSMGLAWGWVGVEAARRLARGGIEATPIVNAYTTYSHETRAKVKGVGRVHGPWQPIRARMESLWVDGVVDRYERRAFRESRLVLVNYEAVREIVTARHGRGGAIRRIPYTTENTLRVDQSVAAPDPPTAVAALRPARAPLILAISRQDPRKGIDVLLRALADLRSRGVPFRACLVGGGALLGAHRRLAAELGLADRVVLTGFVRDADPYLRSADVFALPSLQEGSGSLSLLESLRAGVAVVASKVEGIPEDVTNGESALLVEPGRPEALSRALRALLEDGALRTRLAEGGRRRFHEQFAGELLVEALRDTYTELGFAPQSPGTHAPRSPAAA